MPPKKPKSKKMTNREKALRAQTKKELQQEGILPPDKPKLNRKKFAAETVNEYNETMSTYGDSFYLQEAIGCMVSQKMYRVSTEEVGVLKLMKIAMELKKFHTANADAGKTTYTIGEIAAIITPIIQL